MKSAARDAFEAHLKAELAPRLREIGFKGSGAHFRRIHGDVINTIRIQHSLSGDQCAVNLGLHLTFLPTGGKSALPDLDKIDEIDCEFRRRLAPRENTDYWWQHQTLMRSPAENAADLCQIYFEWGEPQFQAYDSVAKIAAMYLPEQLSGNMMTGFGGQTKVRAALAMARINAHLGDNSLAAQFARVGLDAAGPAVALKPELRRLASLVP